MNTTSTSFASGRKSSKCGGSSLFQNTVGKPRRRHSASSSTISAPGPDGPVSLNFQSPALPFQADSTKTKSRPSSSSAQFARLSSVVVHSKPKLWAENSSRMTPTRVREKTGSRSGKGRGGNSSASTSSDSEPVATWGDGSAAPWMIERRRLHVVSWDKPPFRQCHSAVLRVCSGVLAKVHSSRRRLALRGV